MDELALGNQASRTLIGRHAAWAPGWVIVCTVAAHVELLFEGEQYINLSIAHAFDTNNIASNAF